MRSELQGNRELVRRSPRAARTEDRTVARTEATDVLWDVDKVGDYLRVPASSIYKMTGRKAAVRIPHIRIGGKLRFRRFDIDRWLTLLTVSNIQALTKMRHKALQVNHGDDSQAQAP